jgi:hypothetical protein
MGRMISKWRILSRNIDIQEQFQLMFLSHCKHTGKRNAESTGSRVLHLCPQTIPLQWFHFLCLGQLSNLVWNCWVTTYVHIRDDTWREFVFLVQLSNILKELLTLLNQIRLPRLVGCGVLNVKCVFPGIDMPNSFRHFGRYVERMLKIHLWKFVDPLLLAVVNHIYLRYRTYQNVWSQMENRQERIF